MDLAQWLHDGRVVALLEIIDDLPAASRLHEAIASDPEQARLMAEHLATEPDMGDWHPRQSQFPLVAELLAAIYDVLVAANSSSDGPPPKPFPRPVALAGEMAARLRDESRDAFLEDLMAGRISATPDT